MITQQGRKQLLIFLAAGLLLGSTHQVHAACNNTSNWMVAPASDIKVFIGYKQEQEPGFGSFGVATSSRDVPYPLPLPTSMLGKEGTGRLSETETSDISYYEPDGKGNWRVCRVDSWWPPSAGDDDAQRTSLRQATERYAKFNPALKKLGTQHMALYSVMYFYDGKGRIARLEQGNFLKLSKKSEIKICRQYDTDDNLILLLNPQSSQSCQANLLVSAP